jgi:C4-dicarboxylate transporter, DctM subunit
MTLYVIGFIVVFLLVLASGIPVGFGLGILALGILTFYMGFDPALSTGVSKAYASLDTSTLVAIPLFIFAAQLIAETGMGKRLFDAARAFMGRFRSGLGPATVLSSGVFSAMTGSSFVAASTMGLIAIPELRRAKYSDAVIAAAISSGGSLGSVIPPSIVMIVYGYLTDESVGKLFMAGMIPGLVLIFLYSFSLAVVTNISMARRLKNQPQEQTTAEGDEPVVESSEQIAEQPFTMTRVTALKEAFWGLMAPIIILGGIYLGIFTASEAAAVAVVYCIIVGFWIYRTLTLQKFWNVLLSSANISAMVAIIVIGGYILGFAVVMGRIPQQILELIVAQNFSPLFLLFLINIILFVLGMFLESLALIYLAIPLLYPVVLHMGWDNIWFAVILLINVNLGLITPPMGGVLFIISQIGGIHINTVIKGAILPVCVLILMLVLLIAFPQMATWLPSLM